MSFSDFFGGRKDAPISITIDKEGLYVLTIEELPPKSALVNSDDSPLVKNYFNDRPLAVSIQYVPSRGVAIQLIPPEVTGDTEKLTRVKVQVWGPKEKQQEKPV